MNRELLLKNSGYWTSKIQIDLYNQLEEFMKENKLNRSQLAEKLGVTKSYISQVLNGDFNHRISKLVEFSLAINKIPEIFFKDIDQLIKEENDGYIAVTWKLKQNKPDLPETQSVEQVGKIVPFNLKSTIEETAVNFY